MKIKFYEDGLLQDLSGGYLKFQADSLALTSALNKLAGIDDKSVDVDVMKRATDAVAKLVDTLQTQPFNSEDASIGLDKA